MSDDQLEALAREIFELDSYTVPVGAVTFLSPTSKGPRVSSGSTHPPVSTASRSTGA
jgi:hypothetical protein